jgi:chromosome segregation ATPase
MENVSQQFADQRLGSSFDGIHQKLLAGNVVDPSPLVERLIELYVEQSAQKGRVTDENKQLKQEQNELRKQLEGLQDENKQLKQEQNELRKQLGSLQEENNKLREIVAIQTTDIECKRAELQKAKERLAATRQEIESVTKMQKNQDRQQREQYYLEQKLNESEKSNKKHLKKLHALNEWFSHHGKNT